MRLLLVILLFLIVGSHALSQTDCENGCSALNAPDVDECAQECLIAGSAKKLNRRGGSNCCEKYRGWGFVNENDIVRACYDRFARGENEPCKGTTCIKPCGLDKGCYGKCAAAAFSCGW
ncbi:21802_t:CDS:1, partial [Racocetra persica]